MKRRHITLIGALAVLAGCADQSSLPVDPLHGAWRVVSMHLISAEQDTVAVPTHESLFLFADGYYSIGYAFGGERMQPYADRWHASEREKVARFSSLIVNAGSYRTGGSRIDAKPLFALAPEFVAGEAVFFYDFAGDTLELTWEKSIAFDGLEYPSGSTVTLLRLVRAGGGGR
jgi:hypothetical protein